MSVVLFSPVGGTDPLSNDNYQDGAILHIVRNYRPNKIVLFVSREILKKHKKDNRYIQSLYLLYKELTKEGKSYEKDSAPVAIKLSEKCIYPIRKEEKEEVFLEYYQIGEIQVELIVRENLSEVQDFNTFYKEFPKWIRHVTKDLAKEDELLLNVSSGTPAMKGCLLSMQILQDLQCRAIQVSTPTKKMNEHHHSGFNLEFAWNNNVDNSTAFVNRSSEVLLPDYVKLIQENQIKRLITEFDYKGALNLAESLSKEDTIVYLSFLKMALQRSLLNIDYVENFIRHKKDIFRFPLENNDEKDKKAVLVFEYCLQMQLKLSRGDLDGFIRSLTPVLWDMFFQIVEKDLELSISDYIVNLNSQKKPKIWKLEELKNGTKNEEQKIYKALTKRFPKIDTQFAIVYSTHLLSLIESYHSEEIVIKLAGELRKVEEVLRNIVAHQMVPVTEKIILKTSGFSAEQIMDKLKVLFSRAYFPCTEEQWNSYEMMNKNLIKVISQKNR